MASFVRCSKYMNDDAVCFFSREDEQEQPFASLPLYLQHARLSKDRSHALYPVTFEIY